MTSIHTPWTRRAAGAAALAAALASSGAARGWTNNEHTRITHGAVAVTAGPAGDAQAKGGLARLWAFARVFAHARGIPLCKTVDQDELSEDRQPHCVSFASLPSFAGDHSCSTEDLAREMAHVDGWPVRALIQAWKFDRAVRDIRADLQSDDDRRRAIVDRRREFDLELLGIDRRYSARAADNKSHFQLPRPRTANDLDDYLDAVLRPGAPLNAIAVYVAHHAKALTEAAAAADADACHPLLAAEHAFRAIFHEAFAVHFLEDAFSAGHLVAAVGKDDPDARRLGTHDHYCAHGYPMVSWRGERHAGYGDGFATEADYEHAGGVVRASLEQVGHVAKARHRVDDAFRRRLDLQALNGSCSVTAGEVDSCTGKIVPCGLWALSSHPMFREVLEGVPVPAPSNPAPPMFENEYGVFLFGSVAAAGGAHFRPFAEENATQVRSGFDASVAGGIGYGMDGVTSSRRDGLFFAGVTTSAQMRGTDALVGLGARFRLPFAYVPGDTPFWLIPLLAQSTKSASPGIVKTAAIASRPAGPLPWAPPLEWHPSARTTLGFAILREGDVQFFWDLKTGRSRGYQFTLPWLMLRKHSFDGDIGGDTTITLSLRAGNDYQWGSFLGPTLSFSHAERLYFP